MAEQSAVLLRAERISKSFAGVRVLSDVSLDLRAGEVHVLAGENGAGKSTLIKVLAGIHRKHEGTVHLSPGARIAVIHQELSLIDSMSAQDNIFLGREPSCAQWVDRRELRSRALALCRELELDIDVAQPVESFPMSVKNRIEIAKALSQDANILIMDEPTSALTAADREKFFEVLEKLKKRGCGIIYISHKMDEIYRLADRITVLRDGRHIGTELASELPEKKFIQWMIGRELKELLSSRTASLGKVMLRTRGISVSNPITTNGRSWLVKDVSFELRAGEIVGLAGLQGSGNTELLNALFGSFGPRITGQIELNGKPFGARNPAHSIKSGLALLTNDRKHTGLILGMSAKENITLASVAKISPKGWFARDREERLAEKWRRELRIRLRSLDQEAGSLSGGNQQKLALAKWLETKPKVLLLDEPTRGVDVGAKQEIYDLLGRLASEGIAIALISTEMPELLALSDRVLVMHQGRMTAELSRVEATQERVLRAAMGEIAVA